MKSFKNDVVFKLPKIEDVEFNEINKHYLNVIFINFFITFIPFITALILLNTYVFSDSIKIYSTLIFITFFIFWGFILFYYIASFPLRKYGLRERDISYKSGLFFKKMTTVPFTRIQHVEIDEGPISRLFNLASISVYTAGDSSDDLVIKGLQKHKALQIKEYLSKKVNE